LFLKAGGVGYAVDRFPRGGGNVCRPRGPEVFLHLAESTASTAAGVRSTGFFDGEEEKGSFWH